MRLEPERTAILTLDFQAAILGMAAGSDGAVANAGRIVEVARSRGFHLIHVGLGFSPGHPELPRTLADSPLARIKQHNLFVKGEPSAEIHPAIFRPGDLVIHKQRVGAFSENQLHLVLRSLGVETLVLMGVATSGIVLSTLRRAFDLDYRSVVVADACFDRDPEVHRVLTETVFAAQARVVATESFVTENA